MGFFLDIPDWDVAASLLTVNGEYLPADASRNLSFKYGREVFGQNVRALDGGLLFLGMPDLGFRFTLNISGNGKASPQVFATNPWQRVEIGCAIPIGFAGQLRAADLIRPAVAGSIRYKAMQGDRLITVGDETMADDTSVRYTFFRPRLMCAPEVDIESGGTEWTKEMSWSWQFREDQPIAQ